MIVLHDRFRQQQGHGYGLLTVVITSTIDVDWHPVGVSINNYSKFSGLILQLFSALGATIKSRTLVQATVLSVSYFIGKTTEVICS